MVQRNPSKKAVSFHIFYRFTHPAGQKVEWGNLVEYCEMDLEDPRQVTDFAPWVLAAVAAASSWTPEKMMDALTVTRLR